MKRTLALVILASLLGGCSRTPDTEGGLQLVEVALPPTIYAVVGDTMQLYYESIFKVCDYTDYDIRVSCDIGNQYPRYYELTPAAEWTGEHDISFSIFDSNGRLLGSRSAVLKVVTAGSQPSHEINVLCIGASLTEGAQWPTELRRRLTGSGGEPAGLGYSGINFVGRREKQWEDNAPLSLDATGGYHIKSYLENLQMLYRFNFSAQAPAPGGVSLDAVYECYRYGTAHVGTFRVTEVNLNGGVGNISCTAVNYPGLVNVYEYGTLVKVSGNGPETLEYESSWGSGNPFLYDGAVDIRRYADEYCGGRIDVVFLSDLLLDEVINAGNPTYDTDFTPFFGNLTVLITSFRKVFPEIKFFIGSMPLPDKLGGLGANYGASGYSRYYGFKTSAFKGSLQLYDYIARNRLENTLYVMNWMNEMDNLNGYEQVLKPVNPRSQSVEPFGTNGLHPATPGYMQMADSAFRAFVGVMVQ